MTTDPSMSESKWSASNRPATYWIIVGIYLIASLAMLISYLGYKLYLNPPSCEGAGYGIGSCFTWFAYPLMIIIFIVFGTPSLMGAIRLFRKNKNAFIPSITALILGILGHLILILGSDHILFSYQNLIGYQLSIGVSLVSLDLTMITLVIVGRRKIFMKSTENR